MTITCPDCEDGTIECCADCWSWRAETHYTRDWREICRTCHGDGYLICAFCGSPATRYADSGVGEPDPCCETCYTVETADWPTGGSLESQLLEGDGCNG